MGHRRGGLYSYDWLDRLFGYLDAPSADRILPEWQLLANGDEIPVGRGAGFPVQSSRFGHWYAYDKGGRMNLQHSVRATGREHLLSLPGDEMIPNAADSLTHAITVRCNRRGLWPWLIQMGADRAGWYSYDVLDNGGRHSADRILQGLQSPSVGTVFPALPGRHDGFILLDNEPTRWLVLGWPGPDSKLVVTWSFMLIDIDENTTRLIVRVRASDDYRFHGMPKAVGLWLARVVHFIMERKQLLEIARRAERHAEREADDEHQPTR